MGKMTCPLCPHFPGVRFQARSQRVLEGEQAEYNENNNNMLSCFLFCINGHIWQYGRLFLESFLKLGMPLLDNSFKRHKVSNTI